MAEQQSESMRFRDYERHRFKNSNIFQISITLLIIAGYLFFFLSPYLLHETPERQYDEIGSSTPFYNGSVTLNSWEYSQRQGIMQVSFTLSESVSQKEITFSTRTNYQYKNKSAKELINEVIYEDEGYYIINIYEVPDDFYCVGLHILEDSGEEVTTVAVEESTSVTEETSPSNVANSEAVFYTCYDAVKTVVTIPQLKELDYKIRRIQSSVSICKTQIQETEIKIEELESENDKLREKNASLKTDLPYKITSEQENIRLEIKNNESTIAQNNETIARLRTSIISLEDDIEEYQEIIEKYIAEDSENKYDDSSVDIMIGNTISSNTQPSTFVN